MISAGDCLAEGLLWSLPLHCQKLKFLPICNNLLYLLIKKHETNKRFAHSPSSFEYYAQYYEPIESKKLSDFSHKSVFRVNLRV